MRIKDVGISAYIYSRENLIRMYEKFVKEQDEMDR